VTVPVSKSFAATLVVGWALAIGCGGRNLPVKPASGGAGTSGHAGAGSAGSSTSGSSGAAGVTGLAGNGGAGAAGASAGGAGSTGGAAGSTGGSGGAGGAAGFKGILGEAGSDGGAPNCKAPCPALTCASGSAPMPDPLEPCCPICKSVKCADIVCPAQTCLPLHHPELGANQCCSACVVDANVCEEAVAEFTRLVGSLSDQLGGPCHSDADCTYTSWNNGCSTNCFVPVTKAGAAMFDAQLQDSTTICNTLCATPKPISCPYMTAVCAQGRCAAKP
jgi:hypothetical protein